MTKKNDWGYTEEHTKQREGKLSLRYRLDLNIYIKCARFEVK